MITGTGVAIGIVTSIAGEGAQECPDDLGVPFQHPQHNFNISPEMYGLLPDECKVDLASTACLRWQVVTLDFVEPVVPHLPNPHCACFMSPENILYVRASQRWSDSSTHGSLPYWIQLDSMGC